jgi:hypothetical protein
VAAGAGTAGSSSQTPTAARTNRKPEPRDLLKDPDRWSETDDPEFSRTALQGDLLLVMAAKAQHQAVYTMRYEFGGKSARDLLDIRVLGYDLYDAIAQAKTLNGAGKHRARLLQQSQARRGTAPKLTRAAQNERLCLIRKLEGSRWLSFDDLLLWQVLLGADFFPSAELLPDASLLRLPPGGRVLTHTRKLRGL